MAVSLDDANARSATATLERGRARLAASLAPKPHLRSIELFTGAGGLALGTHLAGFHHEQLVEWNPDSCRTLRTNIQRRSVRGIGQWKVIEADVRDFIRDLPDYVSGELDLVAGGAPCQPFSIGGKHGGASDRRNMIPFFAEIVRQTAPKAFILENVKGLLRASFREYFDYVLRMLSYPGCAARDGEDWRDHNSRLTALSANSSQDCLSYNVSAQLLNAANYGVPQTRERVLLIGVRSDIDRTFNFPKATHSMDALICDQLVTGSYWSRHALPVPHDVPAQRRQKIAQLTLPSEPGLRPWRTVRDAFKDLPPPTEEDSPTVLNHRLIPGARSYIGHTGSLLDWPSKTLKAGDHGVPGGENMLRTADGVRYYTVREAARVQDFPDGWLFEGAWTETMRQLGNAVPVGLAAAVAKSLAEQVLS